MPILSRSNSRRSIVVMTSANVLFLLRVDLPGRGIGKMRQRHPAEVDMRLRQLGGFRDHDVGVDVDRHGRRSPGEAVGVMDAGGGAAIAILAVDHFAIPCGFMRWLAETDVG